GADDLLEHRAQRGGGERPRVPFLQPVDDRPLAAGRVEAGPRRLLARRHLGRQGGPPVQEGQDLVFHLVDRLAEISPEFRQGIRVAGHRRGTLLYCRDMRRTRIWIAGAVALAGVLILFPDLALASEAEEFARDLDERGFLLMLISSVGLGFTASLTPCVYPMIPIGVGVFGARDEAVTRPKAFATATAKLP